LARIARSSQVKRELKVVVDVLTEKEILEIAREGDPYVSARQLASWREVGALSRAIQRSLGKGKGSYTLYPPESADRLRLFLTLRAGGRSVPECVFQLWISGYPVEPLKLRSAIKKGTAFIGKLRYKAETVEPGELELMCLDAITRKRANLTFISENPEKASSLAASMLDQMMRPDEVNEQLAAWFCDKVVKCADTGEGNPTWLTSDPSPEVRAVLETLGKLDCLIDDISDAELEDARSAFVRYCELLESIQGLYAVAGDRIGMRMLVESNEVVDQCGTFGFVCFLRVLQMLPDAASSLVQVSDAAASAMAAIETAYRAHQQSIKGEASA
jgi:hypothetical protein